MSVYLSKRPDGSLKSPYYQFDFTLKINGEDRRFFGSTKETRKKAAEEYERREKARVKAEKPNDHLTLNEVGDMYYEEVAKHQESADDTATAIEHLCRLIGKKRRFVNITAADIADAARRRAAETYGKKNPKLVSAGSVNRQIVEPMRRLMRRAKKVYGMSCDPDLIDWSDIKRREPKERVREFTADEADGFWRNLRPDYVPFVWFLGARGLRVRAALGLTPKHVDLAGQKIQIWKKGEGMVWVPISRAQAEVIRQEMAKAPGHVWSYEAQKKPKAGMRFRITYAGLRRVIRNTLAATGIDDFRIHDLRHDFASKLLRKTRDLALVQKSLGHADIESTMRYAHVLDEDIAQGLEAMPGPERVGTTGIAPERGGDIRKKRS